MNSLERFETALERKQPDRVPQAYLFFGAGQAVLRTLKASMKDVYYHADGIVRAQLKAREMFRHDNVMAPWGCCTVEAEALGSLIDIPEIGYPKISKYAVENPTDIDRLKPANPLSDGRMPMVLDALTELVKIVGRDTAVVGFMCSPFTILDGIRGIGEAGIEMLTDPDLVKRMLEISTETCIRYGKAMAERGVSIVLIKDGFAGADVISRDHCMEFDIRFLEPVVTALHEISVKVIIGNVSSQPYLDMHVALRPEAVSFASGDLHTVKEKFGKTVCILGNVDQTRMPFTKPREIEQEAKACINKARDGGGYILSTGCEIPLDTPPRNVEALHTAVEKYGVF